MEGDIYQQAWSTLNGAIEQVMTRRDDLDPDSLGAHKLDSLITQLENRRSLLAEARVHQALNKLHDEDALTRLRGLVDQLNAASTQIGSTQDAVGTATQIVATTAALVGLILPLV